MTEPEGATLAERDTETEFLVRSYERMQRIRVFERHVQELTDANTLELEGSAHLCAGQEAIPVGALSALGDDDRVIATYRGHGWALESGIPLLSMMAEICGRAGGINGGRAGSAYMTAPAHRFFGENSIVGAGGPIACGVALASTLQGTSRVVAVSFGDGATSQGALHEALVFAAARDLPVIFVCENNTWSEMTKLSDIVRIDHLADRAQGYGMASEIVDGNDVVAVRDAVARAADRARSGNGPTFLECKTLRLWGHYTRDGQHYRDKDDRAAAAGADPIKRLRDRLAASDPDLGARLVRIDSDIESEVSAAVADSLAMSPPEPDTASDHVYATPSEPVSGGPPTTEDMQTVQAINTALRHEMAMDDRVVCYGEDIARPGGVFGATKRLQKEFGEARVFDTPIAESAILGSAVGAAMDGQRPIVEIMWADFLLVALDTIVNQAANVRYLTRGTFGAPIVVRTQQGALPGSCAQHSQSLEALLTHIPGIKVGMPSTPQDAYAMLRAACRDEDPVVFIESRALYWTTGEVSTGGPIERAEGARLARVGRDIAIISWGPMMPKALAAAEALSADGIEASVLDLRWLTPLDTAAIERVVKTCGRVLIVHEANLTSGFGAEVAATVAGNFGNMLKSLPVRLGTGDSRIPASSTLQKALIPQANDIEAAARAMVAKRMKLRHASA